MDKNIINFILEVNGIIEILQKKDINFCYFYYLCLDDIRLKHAKEKKYYGSKISRIIKIEKKALFKKYKYNSLIDYKLDIFNKLKNKTDISDFLETILLPKFDEYLIIEIFYWIEKVKTIDKKGKNKNDFLHNIYTYQKEIDMDTKRLCLINIINKLVKYIKYSNKNAKNK